MANDNTVNVEITASVEGLKSGLKQAESGIKGFSNEADKMTSKTNKMAGEVKSNAVPALTSFSQVIQDAPYGIQGVANNITQLTSQLGYLSKSAGGTGNALKAMISSLTGPAGILLAVSLVTSLLVSYGDEIANMGNASAEAAAKQGKLVESLEKVSTVFEAQISALDSQIKLLEYQKIPTKELLQEKLKLLQADLQTTVNQRTALYNQIESLRLAGLQLNLAQKLANATSLGLGQAPLFIAGLDKDEIDKINELEANLYSLDKTIADISLGIAKINAPVEKLTKIPKTDPNVIAKPLVEAIEASKPIVNATAEGYLTTWKDKMLGELGTAKNTLEPLTTSINTTLAGLIPSSVNQQRLDFLNGLADMMLQMEKFNADAKNIIENGIANTFSNLGTAIGEAMANGGSVLQATTSAIMGGLGDLLSAMGDYLIKAGTAAVLAGTVTKLFGSIAGVSAGIAAIGGGTILKALGGSIKSFGGAGTDYSSSGTSNKNYGSSASYSGNGNSGGTYVFEIAGTKLIGVLKNTLDRNRNLGGSTNLLFTP